jgi:hypothetical protein
MSDGRKAAAEEAEAMEVERRLALFSAQDARDVWCQLDGAKEQLRRLRSMDPALRRGELAALDSAWAHVRRALGEA